MNPKFYLTTAIAYANGPPHIGHAYEFITSDVIVRFYKLFGYDVFFSTGTDEHGQKVASTAEKRGLLPKDHCDEYVAIFKLLNEKLKISYDRFIRTTDEDHIETAQKLWKLCNNDIYLGSYDGWYNEREETFVTEIKAKEMNYLDGNVPLKHITEPSYYLRMSIYLERLIDYIENNPTFIQPECYRHNILTRLKKEGLNDLSISRTTFDWGIPVPGDSNHSMYVWKDALSNYLTSIEFFGESELKEYWNNTTHIIGKDIIWFHCVIWPIILMSANIPLPKTIFAHGFINADDGRKMSKSYNNTIDPFDLLNNINLSVDSIRYYCCSAPIYGSDFNFSIESLITSNNSELGFIVGNLINRVVILCEKYCDNKVPIQYNNVILPFDLDILSTEVKLDMETFTINAATIKIINAVRSTNKFLQDTAPWNSYHTIIERQSIIRIALEAIYIFTHFLAPIIPITSELIFDILGTKPVSLPELNNNFNNLIVGTKITPYGILFQQLTLINGEVSIVPGREKSKK
jgi:methionyl-tRNA synthetase